MTGWTDLLFPVLLLAAILALLAVTAFLSKPIRLTWAERASPGYGNPSFWDEVGDAVHPSVVRHVSNELDRFARENSRTLGRVRLEVASIEADQNAWIDRIESFANSP